MEGQASAALSESGGSETLGWPRPQRQQQPQATSIQPQAQSRHSSSPLDPRQSPAASATSLTRSIPRYSATSSDTVQAVAPDLAEARRFGAGAFSPDTAASSTPLPREFEMPCHQGSPMAIHGGGGGRRRQGMVFGDSLGESYESAGSSHPSASSPVPAQHHQQNPRSPQLRPGGSTRPRTRTMDAGLLTQRNPLPRSERQRHRIGSVSSSGSQPLPFEERQTSPPPAASDSDSVGYVPLAPNRQQDSSTPSGKVKEKKSSASNKSLLRRLSSSPTSPVPPPMASVDALAIAVTVQEPTRIVSLMKALCGRMRGEIEYQIEAGGPWHTGFAYIDDDVGCLMCHTGPHGNVTSPFKTLVADLRGCRVLPLENPESGHPSLEIVTAGQPKPRSGEANIILLQPLSAEEWSLWYAALLAWQQITMPGVKTINGSGSVPNVSAGQARPGLRRQGQSTSSTEVTRSSNIIKVGTVMVWDKGPPTTPRQVVQRLSTKDPRSSPLASWRKVSCILHENGEFRLLMENDISVLCIIQLSQLSRHGIQKLDHTVLDQDFCIAIFPMYAETATQLSILRPIYLALDGRVPFEVWFVLLRAFAVPDIYTLEGADTEDSTRELRDFESGQNHETFRIEKNVGVRVTEAKIRLHSVSDTEVPSKASKSEQSDTLAGSYLAEVILDGEVRARTTTRTGTNNPFWREDCDFVDLPPTVRELTIVLKQVIDGHNSGAAETTSTKKGAATDFDGNKEETVCGTVTIALDPLDRGKDHEEWLPIMDEKQQSIGSMLVKIWHAEHVALMAKEYEPLSDLLHRFSTGLTTMISAALPGHLRRLSETFLDIFQASGSASDWLMALVEDEIDGIGSQTSIKKFRFSSRLKSTESTESMFAFTTSSAATNTTTPTPSSSNTDRELFVRDMSKSLAGEANLLFRGNTLLTQSLEFHMRRLGSEYLEDVLRDKIVELNDLDPDCEVDPSRLPHLQHNHHHHHAVSADLDQRWNRLILLTTEVWHRVADSAGRLPAELRLILKYIRAVAEDRYGDFLRSVSYTAVSGFLFLRFICPAILSPKLFGLLRDHPRPRAQRTLTLIAKVLQKMANMSVFGKREEWMEPMNKFLSAQRPVFREYIDQVCDIPTDREVVKGVPPSYSTPLTMLGRLSPTAREGFPCLPYLIDRARSFASLVKLWVDACPSDVKRGQLYDDGELLATFHELCVALQRRADACLAKTERFRNAEASSTVDHLAESLEQATLIESLSHSSAMAMAMGTTRPPGSAGSDGLEDRFAAQRSSKEFRGRREGSGAESRKPSGLRQSSGQGGSISITKGRNGKVGRTILSGIMRIGGRAESPDSKQRK
ncbi:hypothetical protein HIM_06742 [Hirsutella minnesotensis 3608]|uniref:Uncharacterized protein n=1 Tax=Hirsutella minnesotensis 3608 TaxID=1043627 RepID=A0A0F8A4M7_9HYPO|nr:hypothetical protein HIM_06742 [Hirsutella minnesotensis 3608]